LHLRSVRRVEHTGQYNIGSSDGRGPSLPSSRVTFCDSHSFTAEIIPPARYLPIPYNKKQLL